VLRRQLTGRGTNVITIEQRSYRGVVAAFSFVVLLALAACGQNGDGAEPAATAAETEDPLPASEAEGADEPAAAGPCVLDAEQLEDANQRYVAEGATVAAIEVHAYGEFEAGEGTRSCRYDAQLQGGGRVTVTIVAYGDGEIAERIFDAMGDMQGSSEVEFEGVTIRVEDFRAVAEVDGDWYQVMWQQPSSIAHLGPAARRVMLGVIDALQN
jgi:hypothetical protein